MKFRQRCQHSLDSKTASAIEQRGGGVELIRMSCNVQAQTFLEMDLAVVIIIIIIIILQL